MNLYWIYAVAAVLLAVCAYVAFAEGYQDQVYRLIYRLVCTAEREITGTKRGRERKAQVIAALHETLPAWARLFVSEKDIDDLIELAVKKMKELLAQQTAAQEAAAVTKAPGGEGAE